MTGKQTFYAWLIARVEAITDVVAAILTFIIMPNIGLVVILLLMKTLIGSLPGHSKMVGLWNLISIGIVNIILVWMSPVLILVGLAISILAGVKAGKFTTDNVDLVIPRSMRWRNNQVDLFNIKISYSFNRTATVIGSLDGIFVIVTLICMI